MKFHAFLGLDHLTMTEPLPPRRTACDRCRCMKLTCARGLEQQKSCLRCMKARVECVTNASARIGRTGSAPRRRSEQQHGTSRRDQQSISSDDVQVPTPASISADSHSDSHIGTPSNHSAQLNLTTAAHVPSGLLHSTTPSHDTTSLDILDPSTISSLPPPLDRQEECERKLAGLHSSLVLDLNIIRGSQTADKCTAIINSPEFSHTYNFMIGRMLDSSAKLIEILEYFVPPRRAGLEESVVCDVPTLLSIFTCYVYLMRIYRIIFVCIHKSVLEHDPSNSKLPPLFPGLHLAGYSLEPHMDLQIKVLIEVCEDRLRRIDELMGTSHTLGSAEPSGLFGKDEKFASLLRSVLDKELAEDHRDGILKGDTRPLPDIFGSLKALRHGHG